MAPSSGAADGDAAAAGAGAAGFVSPSAQAPRGHTMSAVNANDVTDATTDLPRMDAS
jgi:hypothetical protein